METVVPASFGKGLAALTVFKRVVRIYTILAVTKIVTTTVNIIELVSKMYVLCKVINMPYKHCVPVM